MQRFGKKLLGATERFCPVQTSAGRRLPANVFEADNAALRINAQPNLFFLLRAEETHFPIPDADLGRHEAIGLRQADFTFQVGLSIVIDVKHNGGLVVFK